MNLDPDISAETIFNRQMGTTAPAGERIELSVVMPCLNEAETVVILAPWIRRACSASVMPSVFALTLGAQIILSSFFLSILGLRRRNP